MRPKVVRKVSRLNGESSLRGTLKIDEYYHRRETIIHLSIIEREPSNSDKSRNAALLFLTKCFLQFSFFFFRLVV